MTKNKYLFWKNMLQQNKSNYELEEIEMAFNKASEEKMES